MDSNHASYNNGGNNGGGRNFPRYSAYAGGAGSGSNGGGASGGSNGSGANGARRKQRAGRYANNNGFVLMLIRIRWPVGTKVGFELEQPKVKALNWRKVFSYNYFDFICQLEKS